MSARKNRKRTEHSGSSFDSFLDQEGIREEVEAVAIKRVLAWQLEQAMREQQKTKQAMAKQLHTSRSQLDRLLDPRNVSVSLETITRAARALGKRVIIRVADAKVAKRVAAWCYLRKGSQPRGTNGLVVLSGATITIPRSRVISPISVRGIP